MREIVVDAIGNNVDNIGALAPGVMYRATHYVTKVQNTGEVVAIIVAQTDQMVEAVPYQILSALNDPT